MSGARNLAQAATELSWYYTAYPGLVGMPSAHAVLVARCSGLCGVDNSSGGAMAEATLNAVAKAAPIRSALGAVHDVSPRLCAVLRLAYDDCLGPCPGEYGRVLRRFCATGTDTDRKLRAAALVTSALSLYSEARWQRTN